MKHLAALLVALAAATAHAGSHRIIIGGALGYTSRGQAEPAMIDFGVTLIASTVSALTYDGLSVRASS